MTPSVAEEASCAGCRYGFALSVFKVIVIPVSGMAAIPGTLPKHLVRSQQIVSLWACSQKEKNKTKPTA